MLLSKKFLAELEKTDTSQRIAFPEYFSGHISHELYSKTEDEFSCTCIKIFICGVA